MGTQKTNRKGHRVLRRGAPCWMGIPLLLWQLDKSSPMEIANINTWAEVSRGRPLKLTEIGRPPTTRVAFK